MMRVFDLLFMLYPPDYRAEFGDEMRAVFLTLAESQQSESWMSTGWFAWIEVLGLIRGAIYERQRQLWKLAAVSWRISASMAGGAVFASGMHILMYWFLVPGKSKGLARVLEHLASRVFILAVAVGIAAGQQAAKQDPTALEIAKSIYSSSFTALREAKTLEDMRKLADSLDSADWISVDWFGRTILTRRDADRDLESVLALPPERRVTGMDIIWAERDSDRLIVVAWMMSHEVERVDSEGSYGTKGTTHRLMRGALIRDIFLDTRNGWRRIRHDKILPNDTVLAVDGAPRIVPPLDERHRVTPAK